MQDLVGTIRNANLMLYESVSTVEAVPTSHPVKRMEEGWDRLGLADSPPRRFPPPHLVKCRRRRPIHQIHRWQQSTNRKDSWRAVVEGLRVR